MDESGNLPMRREREKPSQLEIYLRLSKRGGSQTTCFNIFHRHWQILAQQGVHCSIVTTLKCLLTKRKCFVQPLKLLQWFHVRECRRKMAAIFVFLEAKCHSGVPTTVKDNIKKEMQAALWQFLLLCETSLLQFVHIKLQSSKVILG
jgi:hypothetical protein